MPSRPTLRRAVVPLVAAASAIAAGTLHAQALDDRWYVGIGGGAALLRPDAASSALDAEETPTASGTLFVGRDLDERTSVQFQLHALGETTLEREGSTGDGDEAVAYAGADASVLYRFFDSRDRAPRGTVFGASLYGRFGLGFMRRETDAELENDADVNFGAGAGVEVYLTRSLALRAEGIFHDRDAGSASLSLVARFGGQRRPPPGPGPRPSPRPADVPPAPTGPDASADAPPRVPSATPPGALPAPSGAPGAPSVPPPRAPEPSAVVPPDATDGPLPDPSTLPETLSLPRGAATDPRTADRPLAPSGPLPDPATLPETLSLPPGTIAETSTGNLPAAPSGPSPDPATLPETLPSPGVPPSDGAVDVPFPENDPTAPVPPAASIPPGTPRTISPSAPSAPGDADGDGVPDGTDTCPRSAAGFPVRENGCALLDGVLSGLRFAPGTAELAPGASEQLDYLASLLAEYPDARIELLAHTDDAGTAREQSILTRARLRTLGTYLVQQGGVRANRLVLRSFGGTRPLYDNRTPEGRAGNNRIEVLEKTN